MNSKHKHLVIFKDLLETEKKAKDLCEKYYKELTDTFLAEKAKEMLFDEEKHVKIAEDLIVMASRYSLRSVDDLMKGDHLCCFYESDEEFKKVLIPFIKQGLLQNEKVIYVFDANTKESIINYLLEDKIDINQYLSKGQMLILSINEAYMKDGIFDPDKMIKLLETETQKAVQEGYSALRVTGEMTWALRGLPGSDRLIEYESKLNLFFPGSRALAICQYDMRKFQPDILMDALRTHPLVIIKGELLDNPNFISPSEFLGKEKTKSVLANSLANLFALKEFKDEYLKYKGFAFGILKNLSEGVAAVNEEGTQIFVNDSFCNMVGFDCTELLDRKPPFAYWAPEDTDNINSALQKMLKNGSNFEFDFIFMRKNGERFNVIFSPKKIEMPDGSCIYIATTRDISKIKKYEMELNNKIRDLEIFNKAAVDRELRIIELKEKLKALETNAAL